MLAGKKKVTECNVEIVKVVSGIPLKKNDGNLYLVRFLKFGPHSKIQFENSTSFTRRVTGKTGEISFAHLTIN